MAAPHVSEADLGVQWHPTGAWSLEADDAGNAQLTLLAHFDDPDQRSVRLAWTGTAGVRREGPNDEARSGHPLFGSGLEDVIWLGEVTDSPLVEQLTDRNRVHPDHDDARFATLRHWIVPLKECTVEVAATTLAVERVEP